MKQIAKNLIQSIAAAFAAGGPVCLLYHRVLPRELVNADSFFSGLEVPLDQFEEQIAYVARSRVPVSMEEFISGLKNGSLPPRAACITFDDGYLDNLESALPILEKYSVPMTIFIAPQLATKPQLAWWYELEALLGRLDNLEIEIGGIRHKWDLNTARLAAVSRLNEYCKVATALEIEVLFSSLRNKINGGAAVEWSIPEMMTSQQVGQVSKHPLVTIGAHTHSHVCLAVLSDDEARAEVQRGRETLQEWGVGPIDYFAYPFGGKDQAGAREAQIVASCGFKAAFTTLLGHATHPYVAAAADSKERISMDQFYLLPRISIGGGDSFSDFLWKVEGGYRVWHQLRKISSHRYLPKLLVK